MLRLVETITLKLKAVRYSPVVQAHLDESDRLYAEQSNKLAQCAGGLKSSAKLTSRQEWALCAQEAATARYFLNRACYDKYDQREVVRETAFCEN